MLKKFLLVVAIGMMVLTLIDCKKNEDPIEPNRLEQLSGTWKCTKAVRNAVTQDSYGDFQLILSGTNASTTFSYSCSGRPSPSPWKSSGTWKYGTDEMMDIIRDPGTDFELPVTYALSGTTLSVTFNFTGEGFSRTSEVDTWVFTFSK